MLGILSELDPISCSEKIGKIIVIIKDLVKENELLLNAKEEQEKEKKILIDENSTLREQLKILRVKQWDKSLEKTKKKIEKNEIELELKLNKKLKHEKENINKARKQKFSYDI